jgi:hypothetical protein
MYNGRSILPADSRRLVVAVDAQGRATAGRICCTDERRKLAVQSAN